MDFEDHWPVTEKALAPEAASLGQVLERLRGRIPPALIGEREWERVLERADPLPPAMAAFPFGFELPLHSSLPTADLGVSVVGGGRTAAFFEEAARSEDADKTAQGVARLLAETKPEDSRLRRVAGRKMLLEYDIDATGQGAHPDPGLFLYPAEGVLLGDRSRDRLGDLQVVVEAIAAATGRDLGDAQARASRRGVSGDGRGCEHPGRRRLSLARQRSSTRDHRLSENRRRGGVSGARGLARASRGGG